MEGEHVKKGKGYWETLTGNYWNRGWGSLEENRKGDRRDKRKNGCTKTQKNNGNAKSGVTQEGRDIAETEK